MEPPRFPQPPADGRSEQSEAADDRCIGRNGCELAPLMILRPRARGVNGFGPRARGNGSIAVLALPVLHDRTVRGRSRAAHSKASRNPIGRKPFTHGAFPSEFANRLARDPGPDTCVNQSLLRERAAESLGV